MMTDDTSTPPSPLALIAGSFLAQALDLTDDPAAIAGELTEISDTGNAAVYSIELESSIGSAAFLVYAYALDIEGDDGVSGAEHYRQALTTLELAAKRDTPGPRLVANAETPQVAFILATTPATWRRLQGEEPAIVATETDLPATSMSLEQRAALAEDLHRTLREANEHARSWLAVIRAAEMNGAEVTFTDEETALALHVLDQANVTPLLNALNLLVDSAQEQAGKVLVRSPDSR